MFEDLDEVTDKFSLPIQAVLVPSRGGSVRSVTEATAKWVECQRSETEATAERDESQRSVRDWSIVIRTKDKIIADLELLGAHGCNHRTGGRGVASQPVLTGWTL